MSKNDRVLSRPPEPTSIGDIQKQLDLLWESFHQDVAGGQAVTRACMSNLMIYCQNRTQAEQILCDLPNIVEIHPARILIFTGERGDGEEGLKATVSGNYAQLSSGWQVCGEQICVSADSEQTALRLPSIAREQLIGDLPTTLLWASQQPPPLAGEIFYELAVMADQIIYDSLGWVNPAKGILAMSRWVARQQSDYIIHNLAWRRLKPWRSLLTQVLDPAVLPGALNRVCRVSIEHGPHALPMAWLLLGWFAYRLGWEPVEGKSVMDKQMVWRFEQAGQPLPVTVKRMAEGEPTLYSLEWRWREGTEEKKALFSLLGDDRLGIVEDRSDVPARVIPAPIQSRSELVSAQLAYRMRDKLFEHALAVANNMAGVLNE